MIQIIITIGIIVAAVIAVIIMAVRKVKRLKQPDPCNDCNAACGDCTLHNEIQKRKVTASKKSGCCS